VLRGRTYEPSQLGYMPEVGLGLTLWHGTFEEVEADWLRWTDRDGHLLPLGRDRAEQAERRAERLAARLRELGVDPDA
jgi:hypothetical protein